MKNVSFAKCSQGEATHFYHYRLDSVVSLEAVVEWGLWQDAMHPVKSISAEEQSAAEMLEYIRASWLKIGGNWTSGEVVTHFDDGTPRSQCSECLHFDGWHSTECSYGECPDLQFGDEVPKEESDMETLWELKFDGLEYWTIQNWNGKLHTQRRHGSLSDALEWIKASELENACVHMLGEPGRCDECRW
jgi:hypothetical protein